MNSYKLFVDDMRDIPAGWIGARTVSEAIAILAALPISHISLDHDIIYPRSVMSDYQPLAQETFKGVAHYVALMDSKVRPQIRIHTANAGAAMTMCDILGLPFEDNYRFYTPESY